MKMYKPVGDLVWNPLLKWPRNAECFCKSGKKFKKCHLNQVAPAVSPGKAKQLKIAMDMDLDVINQIGEENADTTNT